MPTAKQGGPALAAAGQLSASGSLIATATYVLTASGRRKDRLKPLPRPIIALPNQGEVQRVSKKSDGEGI